MSLKNILQVASLSVILGLVVGKSTSDRSSAAWYSAGTPNFAYDCSGKVDGNYPHPDLCTHYVACVAGTHAYEMVCALNHDGKPLHYVQNSGPDPAKSHCDYPEVAGCEGKPTSEAPPDTPLPQTTEEVPPTSAPPADSTTTTTREVPTTTAPSSDECLEYDCRQAGNCTSFQVCENGRWSDVRTCDENLLWNPVTNNGTCDFFKNLPSPIRDDYLEDEECIPPCEWWQLESEKCTGTYHFRKPYDHVDLIGREVVLTCPTDPEGKTELIWNPATLTCGLRKSVPGCGQ